MCWVINGRGRGRFTRSAVMSGEPRRPRRALEMARLSLAYRCHHGLGTCPPGGRRDPAPCGEGERWGSSGRPGGARGRGGPTRDTPHPQPRNRRVSQQRQLGARLSRRLGPDPGGSHHLRRVFVFGKQRCQTPAPRGAPALCLPLPGPDETLPPPAPGTLAEAHDPGKRSFIY